MTRSEKLISMINKSGCELPDGIVTAFAYNRPEKEQKRYKKGIGIVGKDGIYLYENGEKTLFVSYEGVSEFRCETLVGAFRVLYEKDGEDGLLLISDMRALNEVSAAVGTANAVIRGDTNERCEVVTTCPKCGRVLKYKGDVCMRCTGKFKTLGRLFALTKGQRALLVLSVLLFFVKSGLDVVGPYVQKIFVDDYVKAPEVPDVAPFLAVFFTMVAVSLVSILISILRNYFIMLAGTSIVIKLRELVFRKIHSLSLASVSKRPSGELIRRVTGDTRKLQNFLTSDLVGLLEELILFIAVGSIVVSYDWRLAVLVIVPVPFVIVFYRLFWNFMRRLWNKLWSYESASSTILFDTLRGIRVVKSFGMEHREIERYDEAVDKQCKTTIQNETLFAIVNPLIALFAGMGEFFLLYYVGDKILNSEMSFGQMAQFSSYVGMLYGPLRWMAQMPRRIVNAFTSIVKIYEIVDEPTDVPDTEKPTDREIEGNIKFEDVSFGYQKGQTVLRHINFEVKPGEMVGIVGKSGVGKSTLINLVMRMYDAEGGRILLDGVDIRDISQEHLRSNMGVVLQETFLFAGSIYDNIAYARPDATREQVITAAKAAGAHDFIMKLTDGYDTRVGENGHTVSGGERQRIAIARALLHNPKILILDEATASLDTETEKQIQDALKELMRGRTTIAIAHRLSTLRNAARLIVLDKGGVAEVGSHEELMKKKGMYYNLVMAQRSVNKLH